jgi:hypothetical protein
MSLADRVKSKPARRHGIPCSVGELLDSLPEPEAKALEVMLTSGWSQAEIHAAVTAEGHYVGRQTINRHRSQACRCYQVGAK